MILLQPTRGRHVLNHWFFRNWHVTRNYLMRTSTLIILDTRPQPSTLDITIPASSPSSSTP